MNKGYYKYFLEVVQCGRVEKIRNNFSFSSRKKAISHAREFCDITMSQKAMMFLMHYDEKDFNDKNETILL